MKLSVFMVTYNHEKYIAQALDSVLMQEVDFDYEIIVGEDCSTDNTRNILLEYQQKYPYKFKLLLHDSNLGACANFMQSFKACSGDYMAYLEGDDYWTDTLKLQKQVDFLDAHPECAISFHNCEEFHDGGGQPFWLYCSQDQKEISKLEDLLSKCNFIPSCSVMFRNRLFQDFPHWYCTLGIGDWTLHLLNAQFGYIGYINDVMGRHRHHSESTWSMRNQAQNIRDVMEAYMTINHYFNYRYNFIIKKKIAVYYRDLFVIYFKSGEKATALKNLYYSFTVSPLSCLVSSAELLVSFFIDRQPRQRRFYF
ncbi:MAG: glycosyltransferase [Nitrospiraceae bacterium]|nr:glycosyltransferase [Nitrospiraceae bacterium]